MQSTSASNKPYMHRVKSSKFQQRSHQLDGQVRVVRKLDKAAREINDCVCDGNGVVGCRGQV